MKQSFSKKWPFLVKFRLVGGLVLLALVMFFLYLKVVPGGRVVYRQDYPDKFSLGQGFVDNFTPADRLNAENETTKVIGDPIYFSVFTPRTFDRARLTIIYKDNLKIDTPLVEAGVLADKTIWRYNLQPISNQALDYLEILWDKIEDDGKIILQKEPNYTSLSELERDLRQGELKGCSLPAEDCLAIYNYTPNYDYRLNNHQRSLPITITALLRGPHQFYLYTIEGPLHVEFTFDYLRQSPKPSPIEVILSSRSGVVTTVNIPDDGLSLSKNGESIRKIILEEKNLPEGVYKVEVKASDDILIKRIYSSSGKLAFINKIWLATDKASQPLDLYADAEDLQVKLLDPASRQTIVFGDQEFSVSETYTQTDLHSNSGGLIKKIILQKNNLILESNGVFSISADSLFNPNLKKVDRFFSVRSAPPYIIAQYEKPREEEGLKTATAEFNLIGAYREKGKYSFMLSIPGLKAEDEFTDNLEIKSLEIEFIGRTLWQKLGDYWY